MYFFCLQFFVYIFSATQRAYHVDEVKENQTLKVDFNYYLAHQLHPVVSRLCDPLDGTDSSRIAQSLGLDAGKSAVCLLFCLFFCLQFLCLHFFRTISKNYSN